MREQALAPATTPTGDEDDSQSDHSLLKADGSSSELASTPLEVTDQGEYVEIVAENLLGSDSSTLRLTHDLGQADESAEQDVSLEQEVDAGVSEQQQQESSEAIDRENVVGETNDVADAENSVDVDLGAETVEQVSNEEASTDHAANNDSGTDEQDNTGSKKTKNAASLIDIHLVDLGDENDVFKAAEEKAEALKRKAEKAASVEADTQDAQASSASSTSAGPMTGKVGRAGNKNLQLSKALKAKHKAQMSAAQRLSAKVKSALPDTNPEVNAQAFEQLLEISNPDGKDPKFVENFTPQDMTRPLVHREPTLNKEVGSVVSDVEEAADVSAADASIETGTPESKLAEVVSTEDVSHESAELSIATDVAAQDSQQPSVAASTDVIAEKQSDVESMMRAESEVQAQFVAQAVKQQSDAESTTPSMAATCEELSSIDEVESVEQDASTEDLVATSTSAELSAAEEAAESDREEAQVLAEIDQLSQSAQIEAELAEAFAGLDLSLNSSALDVSFADDDSNVEGQELVTEKAQELQTQESETLAPEIQEPEAQGPLLFETEVIGFSENVRPQVKPSDAPSVQPAAEAADTVDAKANTDDTDENAADDEANAIALETGRFDELSETSTELSIAGILKSENKSECSETENAALVVTGNEQFDVQQGADIDQPAAYVGEMVSQDESELHTMANLYDTPDYTLDDTTSFGFGGVPVSGLTNPQSHFVRLWTSVKRATRNLANLTVSWLKRRRKS